MKLAGIILSSSLIASAIACNNPAEQNDETATAKSGIVQTGAKPTALKCTFSRSPIQKVRK